jgi:hypothetical protein
MAKINITPASREITEHFAAGGNVRAAERAAIAAAAPLFYVRMGGIPRYDDMGAPANASAIKATAARKVRLDAKAKADAERNAKAKAERIATAERYAAAINTADGYTDSRNWEDDSQYGFDDEKSESMMLHGDSDS